MNNQSLSRARGNISPARFNYRIVRASAKAHAHLPGKCNSLQPDVNGHPEAKSPPFRQPSTTATLRISAPLSAVVLSEKTFSHLLAQIKIAPRRHRAISDSESRISTC